MLIKPGISRAFPPDQWTISWTQEQQFFIIFHRNFENIQDKLMRIEMKIDCLWRVVGEWISTRIHMCLYHLKPSLSLCHFKLLHFVNLL